MPGKILPRHLEMADDIATDWQEAAMCRGIITDGTVTDDEIIFPKTQSRAGYDPTDDFRRIMCGACPVAAECLQYALAMGYSGAWGGELLSDGRIRKMRQNRTNTRTA